jgi:hypothetical protein
MQSRSRARVRRVMLGLGLFATIAAAFDLVAKTRPIRLVQSSAATSQPNRAKQADGAHQRVKGARLSLTILLVTALVGLSVGFALWASASLKDSPQPVSGGVLIFHDVEYAEPGTVWGQKADLDVEMWQSGIPNVSILQITINFDSPLAGQKWYLVASGDYSVANSLSPSMYCRSGEGTANGDEIRCPSTSDQPSMTFSFGEQLGFYEGERRIRASVVDLVGYDRSAMTVVRGVIPPSISGGSSVTVWLPVSTLQRSSVSGNTYLTFPPIGAPTTSFGAGPDLSVSCELGETEDWPYVVLVSSCTQLNPIKITSTRFDPGIQLGTGSIQYASPVLAADDLLVWRVEGGLPQAQAWISDPFAANGVATTSFIAGLFISFGLSLIAVALDRLLFRSQREQ